MSFPYTHSRRMLRCWSEIKRKELSRSLCDSLFATFSLLGWMKNECKFKETTAMFVNQEQKCCFRRQRSGSSRGSRVEAAEMEIF